MRDDDAKQKAARRAVRVAQKQYDRESDAAQRARQKAFTKAQKEGLSLRDIAEEIGSASLAGRPDHQRQIA